MVAGKDCPAPFNLFLFIFWPCHVVCGILVFQTGIEHIPPAVEVESPNQWTVRDFPYYSNYLTSFPMKAATDKMQTNKCGSLPKNFCLGTSKC